MARLSDIRAERLRTEPEEDAELVVIEEFDLDEDSDDFEESLDLLRQSFAAMREQERHVTMSGWRKHNLISLCDDIKQFLDLFGPVEEDVP